MNGAQKSILVLGVVALLASTFFVPYKWDGYNALRYGVTGEREITHGSENAPLWSPPTGPSDTASRAAFTSVNLDAGQLAIWWGGIVLLTAAGIALASRKKEAG